MSITRRLTPPDWRIAGVYASAGQSVVILAVPGQPDQHLRVKDLLPGGARILSIHPERLCILLKGKRLSLSTYAE